MNQRLTRLVVMACAIAMIAACGSKPPVETPQPPPPPGPTPFPSAETSKPTAPPDPPPLPVEAPVAANTLLPWNEKSIEAINGPDSPLKPIFFSLDSDELDDEDKKTLAANAEVLKTYSTWVITVEGHCDERGTAEYNLALGDRRAQAARAYLVSLGIAADRMRIVSYGKEFPFDPGHTETAWTKNRRAHFMLTAK